MNELITEFQEDNNQTKITAAAKINKKEFNIKIEKEEEKKVEDNLTVLI